MQQRKRLRLPTYDYSTPGAYFVTVCARDGACIFGRVVADQTELSRLGRIVEGAWRSIPRHHAGVRIDAFVVVPNHVHGIIWLDRAGQVRPLPIPAVVGGFKARASRITGRSLWQRSYHERVVRDETELTALRTYIAENPPRWAVDRENPDSRRGRTCPAPTDPRSRPA